jgi:hypothetical protein
MKAVSTAASAMRHTFGVAFEALILVVIAASLALAVAIGGGHSPGGASTALAGHASRYPGTLVATPNTLHAGDYFDVTGCGYDRALGNVVVGFTGGSWGSALDADGCFTITDIPALSGDTLAPGTYEVRAYQYIHKKWTETGDTTVTVVR